MPIVEGKESGPVRESTKKSRRKFLRDAASGMLASSLTGGGLEIVANWLDKHRIESSEEVKKSLLEAALIVKDVLYSDERASAGNIAMQVGGAIVGATKGKKKNPDADEMKFIISNTGAGGATFLKEMVSVEEKVYELSQGADGYLWELIRGYSKDGEIQLRHDWMVDQLLEFYAKKVEPKIAEKIRKIIDHRQTSYAESK